MRMDLIFANIISIGIPGMLREIKLLAFSNRQATQSFLTVSVNISSQDKKVEMSIVQ